MSYDPILDPNPDDTDLFRAIRRQARPTTPPGVEVIPPLTHARCDKSIVVLVVRSRISAHNVIDYYCEWWVDGTLHTGWFDEARLTTENGEKMRVGYRP